MDLLSRQGVVEGGGVEDGVERVLSAVRTLLYLNYLRTAECDG